MKDEETLRNQLLSSLDEILDILNKEDSVEIKNSRDGITIFDVNKKKVKKH